LGGGLGSGVESGNLGIGDDGAVIQRDADIGPLREANTELFLGDARAHGDLCRVHGGADQWPGMDLNKGVATVDTTAPSLSTTTTRRAL
jgi:hypothetical protein